jgi:hypothetical protein
MREKLLTLDRTSCRRLGVILLACVLLSGCGGSHAEYAPKSPWIGTRVTFGLPMAYITKLPGDYGDKEAIKIGRAINTLERAEDDKRYIRTMKEITITPVTAGMTFEVIAVFTVVHNGYTRMFAPDYDVLVLRDNLGNVSTIMLDEFQAIMKERTGDPSEGSKMNQ